MKLIVLIFSIFLNINSCSSDKSNQVVTEFIEKITYQNWVGGVKGAGGGLVLNIYLLKKLPVNAKLTKIEFQGRVAILSKINDFSYQTSIKTFDNKLETVPTPTIKTDLKTNQVKVYFKMDGKNNYLILDNVIEVPMVMYPSVKPRI